MKTQKTPLHSPQEGVRLISYCPLCHTNFNPFKIKVLEEKGDSHLLHTECPCCHSSVVILVLASELGISSVGLVTDLTGDEVIKFKNFDAITSDDVIEIHHQSNQKQNLLAYRLS